MVQGSFIGTIKNYPKKKQFLTFFKSDEGPEW